MNQKTATWAEDTHRLHIVIPKRLYLRYSDEAHRRHMATGERVPVTEVVIEAMNAHAKSAFRAEESRK